MIVGAGNSSFELANLLYKCSSNITIIGKKRNISTFSNYSGDISPKYLKLLDSISNNKTVLIYDELDDITVIQSNDVTSENLNKYYLVKKDHMKQNNIILNKNSNIYFDNIIFCTGKIFDNSIFDNTIEVPMTPEGYPIFNYNFQSVTNPNLYFVGSLMHLIDNHKSNGFSVCGYKYLIDVFYKNNFSYRNPDLYFKFENSDLTCYEKLTSHIINRINYSNSINSMPEFMVDVFYYDKTCSKIFYHEDFLLEANFDVFTSNEIIHVLKMKYGLKDTNWNNLGNYNQFVPSKLHPVIETYKKRKDSHFEYFNTISIKENLFTDYSSKEYFELIYSALKSCSLLI